MPTISPYGSWKSPVTSELIVSKNIGLGGAFAVGDDVFWTESRPAEKGRNVLVRRTPDSALQDVTPPGFNVRSTVHEYGGRCLVIHDGKVYFSNFADQRLYVQTLGKPAPEALPLTPEIAWRYADPIVDAARQRLICVREDHTGPGEAVNCLVAVSLVDGAQQTILAQGYNFYSTPRLSPDGTHLAWLSWNHPNMPWDGTELWLAKILEDSSLGAAQLVAGGLEESIFQPEWSPDGTLYFISDRSGWWNLYRRVGGTSEALCPMEAEFGLPQWSFGAATYGFASSEKLICVYEKGGESHLASLDLASKQLTHIETPYTDLYRPSVSGEGMLLTAGSATQSFRIVRLDLATGDSEILRRSSDLVVNHGYLSIPELLEFPTENGLTAYGYYYGPRNQDFVAPAGELPPLLVLSHGGPTGATGGSFSLGIQYWTSRGFAVMDVNYGGSTGYGRAYRKRLNGNWGVVDVDDCCNAALYLARQGMADPQRLAIRGGSAGGYTTLCALALRKVFNAGASHFGIGDLTTFVYDTHKFESRYLDRLVGPYPERKDLYYERSAINFVDQISCPLILFQGLEDKVVPPSQSEAMYAAVKAKGLPVAYIAFEGEQHGFRKAENIRRALDAELYFYGKVFGFELAEAVEPVQIDSDKGHP
jgi:dipeptidyl aminopeptidase/acylaminoacyl peptidase